MTYILEWMLGTGGRSIVGFLERNPVVWTVLLGGWFLFYLLGRWQLDRIRQKTEAMTIERARQIIANKPNVTASGIYKRILPAWKDEVGNWAWFVPNRLEIWPIPPTPENVMAKFEFTPASIAALLRKNGISLQPTAQIGSKDSGDAADLNEDN